MMTRAQWAPAALVGFGLFLTACSDVVGVFAPGEPVPWIMRAPIAEGATEVAILATETTCASGNRADDRISVTVEESDESVTITAKIKPRSGSQDCQGNPPTPFTVELESELNGRNLVDGATGEIRETLDVLTSVRVGTPAERIDPVVPSSRNASRVARWVDPQCGVVGISPDTLLPSWMADREVVSDESDLLLGYAVHSFGLKPTGWHEFRAQEHFGRSSFVWIQYLNGAPVGTVQAWPALIGYNLQSIVCSGEDWAPDEAPPTNVPFDVAEQSPELELGDIFATTDGFAVNGGGVSFVDSNHRCRAWIALEDNLESAGLTVYSTVGYAETPALYFVSKGDGTHYFSNSLKEHNRAVNRFQR